MLPLLSSSRRCTVVGPWCYVLGRRLTRGIRLYAPCHYNPSATAVAHRGTQANKKTGMLTVKSASDIVNVSVKNPCLYLICNIGLPRVQMASQGYSLHSISRAGIQLSFAGFFNSKRKSEYLCPRVIAVTP